jgi:hypothetical protein
MACRVCFSIITRNQRRSASLHAGLRRKEGFIA